MTPLWEEAAAHRDKLLAWAGKLTRDPGAAEEAVQDTLLTAWRHGGTVRDHRARWAWLHTVLWNRIRTENRRRRRWPRSGDALPDPPAPSPPPGDAEDVTPSPEVTLVIDCLRSLKPSYQDALSAVYEEGLTLRQFGESRGITLNNAKIRVYRARNALRRAFARARDDRTGSRTTASDSPPRPDNA